MLVSVVIFSFIRNTVYIGFVAFLRSRGIYMLYKCVRHEVFR